MAAQWYAVIDEATGEALSFGTVLADPLPAGMEAIPIDGPPRGRVWVQATRTLSDYPVVPDLKAEYAAATTQTAKLDVIAKKLGLA
jgi:hypothetical protein